jgi:hypothetical protein
MKTHEGRFMHRDQRRGDILTAFSKQGRAIAVSVGDGSIVA